MKIFLKSLAGILGFIALGAVLLFVLRNINRQPSIALTSEECEAPCWYGITPGITDSWSTYEIMNQIKGVNINSIHGEYDREGPILYYSCYFQRPVEDSLVTVYFSDDIVNAISLLTVNSLTLEDFFEKFGEPDEYWTQIGQGENSDYLDILLFYPTKGYLTEVTIDFEIDATQVEIKETTPVLRVTFFNPAQFEELLTTKILIDQAQKARTGSFVPWTGYGIISFINQE